MPANGKWDLIRRLKVKGRIGMRLKLCVGLGLGCQLKCVGFWCDVGFVRAQLKCDGTRRRMGGEVKRKLANGVGSQYSSHYLGTWCTQHYYR